MSLDALASSHAISLPVTHPKQIKEIFDTITYRKVSIYIIYICFDLILNSLGTVATSIEGLIYSGPC